MIFGVCDRIRAGGFQWGSYSIAWSDIQQDDKPIGRGTFGIVYHGRYRNTEVAIKRIINQDRASEVVKGTESVRRPWAAGYGRAFSAPL